MARDFDQSPTTATTYGFGVAPGAEDIIKGSLDANTFDTYMDRGMSEARQGKKRKAGEIFEFLIPFSTSFIKSFFGIKKIVFFKSVSFWNFVIVLSCDDEFIPELITFLCLLIDLLFKDKNVISSIWPKYKLLLSKFASGHIHS